MVKTRQMAIDLATGKVVSRGGVVSMTDVVDSMIEAVVETEGVGVSMIGVGVGVGEVAVDSVATGEDVVDEVASTEAVAAEGATGVDLVTGTRGAETGEGSTKEEDLMTEKVLREETILKTKK